MPEVSRRLVGRVPCRSDRGTGPNRDHHPLRRRLAACRAVCIETTFPPELDLAYFLGEPVARSLSEVEGSVDVVEVFRPAAEAPQIAREAIKVGAKVLWLQLGIESQEAEQVAEAAGLTLVMDRCMGVRRTASSAWDLALAELGQVADDLCRGPAVTRSGQHERSMVR